VSIVVPPQLDTSSVPPAAEATVSLMMRLRQPSSA
jgi:hypothetical protein